MHPHSNLATIFSLSQPWVTNSLQVIGIYINFQLDFEQHHKVIKNKFQNTVKAIFSLKKNQRAPQSHLGQCSSICSPTAQQLKQFIAQALYKYSKAHTYAVVLELTKYNPEVQWQLSIWPIQSNTRDYTKIENFQYKLKTGVLSIPQKPNMNRQQQNSDNSSSDGETEERPSYHCIVCNDPEQTPNTQHILSR